MTSVGLVQEPERQRRRVGLPLKRLHELAEYGQAGLGEFHTQSYLPGLAVGSVEEFLGLVRAATPELAAALRVDQNRLVELYNSALVNLQPSKTSPETIEEVLGRTYALGAELTAPPGLQAFGAAGFMWAGPPPGEPLPPPAEEAARAGLVSLIDDSMPPVRDQLQRGTCVAFSAVAALEYTRARTAAGPPEDLSEQYLYWLTKAADGAPSQEGTWLQFAFPLCEQKGVCREALWPYNGTVLPGNLTQGPPPDGEASAADALLHTARARRILRYREPAVIEAEIREGRPVAIAIPVFKTWYDNPATRTFGNIVLPLETDRFALNGHAMLLVGFEREEGEDAAPGGGYFVVRNSWGERWASESQFGAGYGTIPYAYVERFNVDAWAFA
jgi:hypothetical protein